jgi:hypothetical protein
MAKTQAEWFSSLKSWVPEWFFEREDSNVAVFQSIAKILEASQLDVEDQQMQTFILEAVSPYLDLHGSERSVTRLSGEFDPQYAIRIRLKSLVSQLSKPSILALVNALLIKGVASIREDFEGSVFVDREEFVNRGAIVIEPIDNTFTILVDKQIRDPYSFANRENFVDRSDFVGNSESSEYVFDLILNAVNENKALGVFYRIIERIA